MPPSFRSSELQPASASTPTITVATATTAALPITFFAMAGRLDGGRGAPGTPAVRRRSWAGPRYGWRRPTGTASGRSAGTGRRAGPRRWHRLADGHCRPPGSPSTKNMSRNNPGRLRDSVVHVPVTPSTCATRAARPSSSWRCTTITPVCADERHVPLLELELGAPEGGGAGEHVALAYHLLLGREPHPTGLVQLRELDAHVVERQLWITRQDVGGQERGPAVGERRTVAREPHRVQLGGRHVATAEHDPGQAHVHRRVLEVVPAVPLLDGVGVAVERGEDQA